MIIVKWDSLSDLVTYSVTDQLLLVLELLSQLKIIIQIRQQKRVYLSTWSHSR